MKLHFLLLFTLATPIHSRYNSQCGQDKFVNEQIFCNKKNGVFLDIGAYDGRLYSNTLFFEEELGWKGICIEPTPSVFERLLKNRTCTCINACAAEKEGFVKFLISDLDKVLPDGGPEMLNGMVHTYDPRHFQRLTAETAACHGSCKVIEVKTVNVNQLLNEHKITHIDYLSVDTEGSELEILRTINYNLIHISVISVENNFSTDYLKKFLTTKNFKLIKNLGGDEIYVNQRK